MVPSLNAYNVSVTYFEPRYITITIPAESEDAAKTKALEFLSNMKDPTIIEAYDIATVSKLRELISEQAEQLGDEELMEALGIVNPVHDPKEIN